MIVVTVARKPLAGTVAETVLKHGTGGIHIDACRVGTNDNLNGGTYSNAAGRSRKSQPPGDDHSSVAAGAYALKAQGAFVQPEGRWPANLVLQHLDGCVQEGTKKVKGGNDPRRKDGNVHHGGKIYGGGLNGTTHFSMHGGFSDTDGTETVAAWSCAPGCPVAALDAMSGACGAFAPVRGTEPSEAAADIYGKRQRVAGQFYGDVGGASRFFKQVQG